MFSAEQFVHFVFQNKHDTYYTDTLLQLDSNAYLWYVLKQQKDIVFLVTDSDGDLTLEVFDSESSYAARSARKKLFHKTKSQSEGEPSLGHETCRLQELESEKEMQLGWLLECPARQAHKNKQTAIAITLEAFTNLYRKAREKDRQKLHKMIQNPDNCAVLIIQLPIDTQKIADAFVGENAIFPSLSESLSQVTAEPREPLMNALRRQLEQQLVDLRVIKKEDCLAMLLQQAVIRNDWANTLQELEELAEYLQYYFQCEAKLSQHSEAFQKISRVQFLREVQHEVALLRQKYPHTSITEALMLEKPEASAQGCESLPLVNYSPLAKKICSISLPEKWLQQSDAHLCWQVKLENIQQAFRTVWNCPQNATVCKWADIFCTETRTAIQRQDWDTLEEALGLLHFCAEQICCAAQRNESLLAIFEMGKNLINLSYNHFLRTSTTPAFSNNPHGDSLFERKRSQMRQFQEQATQVSSQAELIQIEMIHSGLYTAMCEFNRRLISKEEIDRICQDAQRQMEAQAKNAQTNASVLPPTPPKKPLPDGKQEEQLSEDSFPFLAYGDEEPETEKLLTCTENNPTRQAGDTLLKRLGLK